MLDTFSKFDGSSLDHSYFKTVNEIFVLQVLFLNGLFSIAFSYIGLNVSQYYLLFHF